jgi:hypothetical protein
MPTTSTGSTAMPARLSSSASPSLQSLATQYVTPGAYDPLTGGPAGVGGDIGGQPLGSIYLGGFGYSPSGVAPMGYYTGGGGAGSAGSGPGGAGAGAGGFGTGMEGMNAAIADAVSQAANANVGTVSSTPAGQVGPFGGIAPSGYPGVAFPGISTPADAMNAMDAMSSDPSMGVDATSMGDPTGVSPAAGFGFGDPGAATGDGGGGGGGK